METLRVEMDCKSPYRVGARALCSCALLLLAFAVASRSEVVPRVMAFQGRILESATQRPFTGTRAMVFKIYSVAAGGSALWTENQNVEIQNGLYMVSLGSVTPLNLPFDGPYWLGVAVEGGAEMTPRFKLRTAPYAFVADTVSHLATNDVDAAGNFAADAPTFVINADSQFVGIGTASPTESLTIMGKVTVRDTLLVQGTMTSGGPMIESGVRLAPVGQILMWAGGTSAPSGYRVCDGSAVSRAAYPVLFALIGTTYGTGDGVTTFNLPSLSGRIPVGKSTSTWCDVTGEQGGLRAVGLTATEMPVNFGNHNHTFTPPVTAPAWMGDHTHLTTVNYQNSMTDGSAADYKVLDLGFNQVAMNSNSSGTHGHSVTFPASTVYGGGTPHNNLQPYLTVLYIIKCQ